MVVASTLSVVAGLATFFATRHPGLALKVGKATLAAIGGASVVYAVGLGGTVAEEIITEENPEKKKETK